jgi:hypothetical protein
MVQPYRTQEVPRESFLTTGPPPARAWKNPDRETILVGARVVLLHQDGHRYDWRALTNPFWLHRPTGLTWGANAPLPDEIAVHELASDRWLVVDVVPEVEWYRWKDRGDSVTPHPLQTVFRVPVHMIWVE